MIGFVDSGVWVSYGLSIRKLVGLSNQGVSLRQRASCFYFFRAHLTFKLLILTFFLSNLDHLSAYLIQASDRHDQSRRLPSLWEDWL